MTRKFGVKVTFKRVTPEIQNSKFQKSDARHGELPWPPGKCVCGKSNQQCGDDWDRKLGITSRSQDSYHENLSKVRTAEINGDDPYCRKARQLASGYRSDWTPYMPPGSFVVPTTPEVRHGKKQGKRHGGRHGGTDTPGTGGSGRRRNGKPIRRGR